MLKQLPPPAARNSLSGDGLPPEIRHLMEGDMIKKSDELFCTALISSPLSKHWAQLEPGNAKSNVDCD
jgi:hypothetical protein